MKRGSAWLKNIRKKNGLTQKQLAEKIGISVNTLSSIEQKQHIGSEETWNKIANFFGEKEYMKVSRETLELLLNDIDYDMVIILFKERMTKIIEVGNFTSKDIIVDTFMKKIENQNKKQSN